MRRYISQNRGRGIQIARDYLTYMPANYTEKPKTTAAKAPKPSEITIQDLIPKIPEYPI